MFPQFFFDCTIIIKNVVTILVWLRGVMQGLRIIPFSFKKDFSSRLFFAIIVSFPWAVIYGNYLGNFKTMWEEVPSHDAFVFLQLGPISSIK